MLDVSKESVIISKFTCSCMNAVNVIYICNLIIKLHETVSILATDIIILFMYHNQYLVYRTAIGQLMINKKNIYNMIHVHKINVFQRNQTSVVISNLVMDKKFDFLNESNCINTALSCALHEHYIIVNLAAFELKQYKHVNQYYSKMISYFKHIFYKIKNVL